jgi:hypothetical protein
MKLCRGNGVFANMKPTTEAKLCSLPHRRWRYVSVDSLQRYGFRISFVLRCRQLQRLRNATEFGVNCRIRRAA